MFPSGREVREGGRYSAIAEWGPQPVDSLVHCFVGSSHLHCQSPGSHFPFQLPMVKIVPPVLQVVQDSGHAVLNSSGSASLDSPSSSEYKQQQPMICISSLSKLNCSLRFFFECTKTSHRGYALLCTRLEMWHQLQPRRKGTPSS